MHKKLLTGLLCLAAFSCATEPSFADSCGIALELLVDVSGSVNPTEYNLEKQGYVRAFQDPRIESTIAKSKDRIFISLAEWGGDTELVIPWTQLKTKEDLYRVADIYEHAPRKYARSYTTDIAQAINFGIKYFDELPCKPERKIIDVSGDGSDDGGEGSTKLYDSVNLAQSQDITINGLPIVSGEVNLELYYRHNVITSDGFIVPAKNFLDFTRTLIKKLIFELS